jgi:hypothetical protein
LDGLCQGTAFTGRSKSRFRSVLKGAQLWPCPELAERVRRFNSFKCVIPSDEPASGEESRDLLFDFFSGLFSRAAAEPKRLGL